MTLFVGLLCFVFGFFFALLPRITHQNVFVIESLDMLTSERQFVLGLPYQMPDGKSFTPVLCFHNRRDATEVCDILRQRRLSLNEFFRVIRLY